MLSTHKKLCLAVKCNTGQPTTLVINFADLFTL
jgi:hypothetical protein